MSFRASSRALNGDCSPVHSSTKVLARRVAVVVALCAWKVGANGGHDVDGNVLPGLAPEELVMTQSGQLGDRPATITYWADRSEEEKASMAPPYVPPPNRQYDTSAGPVPGMINVHLVPHSHDDVGWQVTIDQYFYEEVFYIIDTVAQNLQDNPSRKFIVVEIAFFARWWEEADDEKRERVAELVANGQMEFINGGWAMHDEASPTWIEMTDQTTRGHQFLQREFNVKPRGTWQIDPFGHTNTQAWLLSYEAGMESLFWGRMDWQDREMRYGATSAPVKGFEWIWQGSQSLPDTTIFAGELFGTGKGGYSTWIGFDDSSPQIVDDPDLHDYNVDQYVDKFVQDALDQYSHTLTEHQMWACGTDFQYQNAAHWYTNLDKLIHYVNQNGTVNAFYSTPTIYTDWKLKNSNISWEVRSDDIIPLADNAHHYWSGFFTSRPALKRQVRYGANLLQAARILEVLSNTSTADVLAAAGSSARPAPRVGSSWTDGLEGAVGLATHHDGMSGTERQDVTDDYSMRISEQTVVTEFGIAASVAKLAGPAVDPSKLGHCNCVGVRACLNASICDAMTEAKSKVTFAAWNSLGQPRTEIAMLPVVNGSWSCNFAGESLPTQLVPLDNRTKELPLMYLNSFNMTSNQIAAAEAGLANKADALLAVEIKMPAVGFATFECLSSTTAHDSYNQRFRGSNDKTTEKRVPKADKEAIVVSNEYYALEFNATTKALTRITNLGSGISANLTASWGWYNSSVGGCTAYPGDLDASIASPPCDDQKSGAYIFRPNSSDLFGFDPADFSTLEVIEGELVVEVRQKTSSWASHVFRLFKGAPFVEVEWTAGPIPIDTSWFETVAYNESGHPLPNIWGKEVVLKYKSNIASNGSFYTDSNGREMLKRVLNRRGPSYPDPYNISEPVAGNYYSITQLASIDDGDVEFAVAVDTSLGGASLESGSLEFMVHRRIQDDDSRGVQEPLNETMCGCNDINAAPGNMGEYGHEGDGGCVCQGLTVRGKHWLVLDAVDDARAIRRELVERLNTPTVYIFDTDGQANLPAGLNISAVAAALPANVRLATLTSNYAQWNAGAWLLRLAHLYQVGEHPTLATPVQVDLSHIFGKSGLQITSAVETKLTANQPKPNSDFEFPVVTINPMEVRTFLAYFE